MTKEYFDLVKEHGVDFFGCDKKCIDKCTNPKKYNLYTVDKCLDKCKCKGDGVLDISISKIDNKKVAMFGEGKPYGMDYFSEHFVF